MRIWLQRLLLGLLAIAGLYLAAANLFLNSPAAGRAFSRRPERFRIGWSAAWTVWPGRVHVRGLEISGRARNVAWVIAADQARGSIGLRPLLRRHFVLSSLGATGVRASVLRRAGIGPPPRPRARRRHSAWTFRFAKIRLESVREVRFNAFRLNGSGQAEGSFWFVPGGEIRLQPSRLRMPGGRLALGSALLAQPVDVDVEASLGPYAPRRHPGLAGFDFLSASLHAKGAVAQLPFLENAGLARPAAAHPGSLTADLRVARGRLAPGSRLVIASPFRLTMAVERGPRLRLRLAARNVAAGRGSGPPAFRAAALDLASSHSETRLSRLFAAARSLRRREHPSADSWPAAVRASGMRIAAPGSRAVLQATVDRAVGRIDLGSLLRRRISLDGLQADGVAARLVVARTTAPPGTSDPWSVAITGARLTGIREVAFGGYQLAGAARAETTFSYAPDGTLEVGRAAFTLPAGRLLIGGRPAAEGLSLRLEGRCEPAVLGRSGGPAFLRSVSGAASVRGRISSLGFLRPYLSKASWLTVEGQGGLTAEVGLDHGLFTPGSRLEVRASPIRATLLDSLAIGRGTVTAAVEPGKPAPLTALRVRFDRFSLADLRQRNRPAYIQGRELRIAFVTPAALDLTAPVPDFEASLDLADGEVPDLSIYNALIPEETGLSILRSRGSVRLHLTASTATRRARGQAVLSSPAARLQFQNLELQGGLSLRAPLVSPDLESRRFDLAGARLELSGVSYQDVDAAAPALPADWWARAELAGGSVVWGAPLSLRGHGRIEMKDSGPLLTLFAQRNRFLRWFDDVLKVENVQARGAVRIGNGAVEVESLQATGGPLELRSRMSFSKTRRLGDLYVRHGRLAAAFELRDGQRNVKLRRPLEWFESRRGMWASP